MRIAFRDHIRCTPTTIALYRLQITAGQAELYTRAGMADTVKDDLAGINGGITHCFEDFLKAFVQVFRHDWPAVCLTDDKPIIHIPIITQLDIELVLHLLQDLQLLSNCLRNVNISDAALSLGLFQDDQGSGSGIQVRKPEHDVHFGKGICQLFVYTVNHPVDIEHPVRGVVSVPLCAADLAAAKAAAAGAEGPGHITEDDVRRIPLMGVLAISPQAETPLPSKTPDVHIATSVLEIGQRFGLTGREVEVLTLYALGHTQARVSEELQLSTNTVHTHIKRIYEKTDLHSRQEILDYISEYGGRA